MLILMEHSCAARKPGRVVDLLVSPERLVR